MASTRVEIRTLTIYNTKRDDKETLINLLCDVALKYAVNHYAFEAKIETTERTCVAEQDYVELPDNVIELISVRARDTVNEVDWPIAIKGRQYWSRLIGTPGYSSSRKPAFGLVDIANSQLRLSPVPNTTDYQIVFQATSYPSFVDDTTENPFPVLDLWIVAWVTAQVFDSLQVFDSALRWHQKAAIYMQDAISVSGRVPAKRRQLESRQVGLRSNNPIGDVIHTTGDLGSMDWR